MEGAFVGRHHDGLVHGLGGYLPQTAGLQVLLDGNDIHILERTHIHILERTHVHARLREQGQALHLIVTECVLQRRIEFAARFARWPGRPTGSRAEWRMLRATAPACCCRSPPVASLCADAEDVGREILARGIAGAGALRVRLDQHPDLGIGEVLAYQPADDAPRCSGTVLARGRLGAQHVAQLGPAMFEQRRQSSIFGACGLAVGLAARFRLAGYRFGQGLRLDQISGERLRRRAPAAAPSAGRVRAFSWSASSAFPGFARHG